MYISICNHMLVDLPAEWQVGSTLQLAAGDRGRVWDVGEFRGESRGTAGFSTLPSLQGTPRTRPPQCLPQEQGQCLAGMTSF